MGPFNSESSSLTASTRAEANQIFVDAYMAHHVVRFE
jgi:hypothetical protein